MSPNSQTIRAELSNRCICRLPNCINRRTTSESFALSCPKPKGMWRESWCLPLLPLITFSICIQSSLELSWLGLADESPTDCDSIETIHTEYLIRTEEIRKKTFWSNRTKNIKIVTWEQFSICWKQDLIGQFCYKNPHYELFYRNLNIITLHLWVVWIFGRSPGCIVGTSIWEPV